jgi:hypothetical protein
MLQRKAKYTAYTTKLTDETIYKYNPRCILPSDLNTDYHLNGEIHYHRSAVWSDPIIHDTAVIKDIRCDVYIYSFIDGENMRVQYNRPTKYWEPEMFDVLRFERIPSTYYNKRTDKTYYIQCFDGMFDSFFNRCDYYGYPIQSNNLSLLQAVKRIEFNEPPLYVLSMNEMFRNLPLLESIDLRNWRIPPWCLNDPNFHPFVNCPNLREIQINDPNVTDEHLHKWLTFNFDNLNNRSPISNDTVAAYNAHKYIFKDNLEDIANRGSFDDYCDCFNKEFVSYGKPEMDMNEMANWYRCLSIYDHSRMSSGYDWFKRGNEYSLAHTPYYIPKDCRIMNPIDDESLTSLNIRRLNAIDYYRDKWWSKPPEYRELLTNTQWESNRPILPENEYDERVGIKDK